MIVVDILGLFSWKTYCCFLSLRHSKSLPRVQLSFEMQNDSSPDTDNSPESPPSIQTSPTTPTSPTDATSSHAKSKPAGKGNAVKSKSTTSKSSKNGKGTRPKSKAATTKGKVKIKKEVKVKKESKDGKGDKTKESKSKTTKTRKIECKKDADEMLAVLGDSTKDMAERYQASKRVWYSIGCEYANICIISECECREMWISILISFCFCLLPDSSLHFGPTEFERTY